MNVFQKTLTAAVAFAAAAAPIAAEAHDHNRHGGWGRPPVQQFYRPAPRQHHNDAGAIIGGLAAGAIIGGLLGQFGQPQQAPRYVQPQYVDPGYQPPPPDCSYRGQHQCVNPYTGNFVR